MSAATMQDPQSHDNLNIAIRGIRCESEPPFYQTFLGQESS